ncbi:leukocyte elastase inhibitor-like isoform X2 [Polyodon spathula]|nr:leukocyte elastase inhibitor-like isoform X2 [Polyodon spathula]
MESLASANTSFALELFKNLTNDRKAENIFYSPLSISSALAMVYLGARGNTAAEIAQVFHIDPSGDIHSGFSLLLADINKAGAAYQLRLANRLYGEKTCNFVKEFIDGTKKFYNAELETVDFKTATEESRQNINLWVQDQTQGKIQNLLSELSVDKETTLVLVNAVYFKGNWKKKFDEELTIKKHFRLSKIEKKPVQMMFQKNKFKFTYIREVKTLIIELPYAGNDLSMMILLPEDIADDTTGLEQLERELTYEKLKDWTNPETMGRTLVEVTLPKFKLEETYDLKPILTSLGMVDAFDVSKSNFSGMSSSNELVLSKAVHKSFVEVNEEGTEAAGATYASAIWGRSSRASFTEEFMADHPFLFFIWHNKAGNILFQGKFCSP